MVKFNSKSTFWFRPDKLKAAGVATPETWTTSRPLLTPSRTKGTATPLGARRQGHWTLTDWFEEVYLRQNGADAYKKLFSPDGDWTDPTVTRRSTR